MRGIHPLDPVYMCNIQIAADHRGVRDRSDDMNWKVWFWAGFLYLSWARTSVSRLSHLVQLSKKNVRNKSVYSTCRHTAPHPLQFTHTYKFCPPFQTNPQDESMNSHPCHPSFLLLALFLLHSPTGALTEHAGIRDIFSKIWINTFSSVNI